MKHFMKKSISMLMVMIMILAMTMVPAFATASNITQVSSTQYTTFLNSASRIVTLYATTTNNYADNVPFSTSTEANAVNWGWTNDGTTIYSTGATSDGQVTILSTGSINAGAAPISPEYPPSGSGYYAYAIAYLNSWTVTPNSYSIVAKTGTGSYANFTIAVESLTNQSPVNAVVRIVDATTSTTLLGDTNVSVARSNSNGSYMLDGKVDAYQRNPSAMGVLDTLRFMTTTPQLNSFTVDAAGAYANTLTIGGTPYAPTGAPTYYGWQYGVYRIR